jgi:hypothetical protein
MAKKAEHTTDGRGDGARGAADGPRAGDAAPEPSAGPPAHAGGSGGDAGDQVCPVGFCPIGMALTTVQGSRPDAVAHLLSAGREFLLAAKAVLDSRADDLEDAAGLERIEVG